jgi:hypothetical protein
MEVTPFTSSATSEGAALQQDEIAKISEIVANAILDEFMVFSPTYINTIRTLMLLNSEIKPV